MKATVVRCLALVAVSAALALLAGAAPALAARATVWAVGDGGVNGSEDDAVAAMIQGQGAFDRFLYLGDVYENGTAADFATRYQPSFGRFRPISSPTLGNHDWPNRATGYDPYWGALAPRTAGGHFYSFDVAGWHFVSLNSEEDTGAGSAQAAWLRQDLARRPGTCTIAYLHRPRFGAGRHGNTPRLDPLWAALSGHGIALLSGHDHNYQRLEPDRGVVQFVAGTGGRGHYAVRESDPRLEASDDREHGALRLRLEDGRASYAFITPSGARRDSGALSCDPHISVRITAPAAGRYGGRSLVELTGVAYRATAPVRLTLVRRRQGRCWAFTGHRFRRAACASRRSVAARGVGRWSYTLPGGMKLARGTYDLTARVKGPHGTAGTDTVRFKFR